MSFLGEIRRRKAFQVAAVYGVVAWLLIQVAATVESAGDRVFDRRAGGAPAGGNEFAGCLPAAASSAKPGSYEFD
jgi:hypothetical protein